jgi:hypothetical protein
VLADRLPHMAAGGRRAAGRGGPGGSPGRAVRHARPRGEGWQLTPVLSLDAIRLLVSLGGRLERDLRSAVLPGAAASELKQDGVKVTLDAGARQLVRMTVARPLADDPVLLGRQQHMAALKVVGSGVDASQTGTGKTVSTARALSNRASTTKRLRAMIVAEGRLLGQWHDELTRGAPGRGLPPLAPNLEVLVVGERRPIAGRIRDFDRALADRPGLVLVPNAALDRYPADLRVIPGTC